MVISTLVECFRQSVKRITVQKSFEKNFSFCTNFSLQIPGYPHLVLSSKVVSQFTKKTSESPVKISTSGAKNFDFPLKF